MSKKENASFMLTTEHIQTLDSLIKSLTMVCMEYDINPDHARNRSLHVRAALTLYGLLITREDWKQLLGNFNDASDFEEHIVAFARKKINNLSMMTCENTSAIYQVESISGAIAIDGQEYEIVLKPK